MSVTLAFNVSNDKAAAYKQMAQSQYIKLDRWIEDTLDNEIDKGNYKDPSLPVTLTFYEAKPGEMDRFKYLAEDEGMTLQEWMICHLHEVAVRIKEREIRRKADYAANKKFYNQR